MKFIIYFVCGLLLLSIGPALIMGLIFTAAIYYFLYCIFKGITSGTSSGGSGGSSGGDEYYESDPGDHWQGTGNPYV